MLGARSGHAKFLSDMLNGFGFFLVEFLDCILVGDYVWTTLGFFCGLKEEFLRRDQMWVSKILV